MCRPRCVLLRGRSLGRPSRLRPGACLRRRILCRCRRGLRTGLCRSAGVRRLRCGLPGRPARVRRWVFGLVSVSRFGGVDVDAGDIDAYFGETCSGYKSYVSCAYYCDVHIGCVYIGVMSPMTTTTNLRFFRLTAKTRIMWSVSSVIKNVG